MKCVILINFCFIFFTRSLCAGDFEKDVFKTASGELVITFIGHGTLMMEFNGKVIHVDPVGNFADYSTLPKADLILVTHAHGDHLDPKSIDLLKKESTEVVLASICSEKYKGTVIMKNGDSGNFEGIAVEAMPAYNIQHERSPGNPFHPKGEGNGYILQFADKKVYIAGDTENIPEMATLENIDIAFLPMNVPYTMTPAMVASAAKMFNPKVLYPYHYGNTDTRELLALLKNRNDMDVRIRNLK